MKKFVGLLAVVYYITVLLHNATFAQSAVTAQTSQSRPYDSVAKKIITTGLGNAKAFEMLSGLVTGIGPRLSGSRGAERAVEWGKAIMEQYGFSNVHLESLMVPHWVRGTVEKATVVGKKSIPLHICALGGSIGTSKEGITAEVLEIHSFEELQNRKEEAKGKIIFFNRPLDNTKFTTFEAYGGAVGQRGQGPFEAAKVGAVAVLVRSMTTQLDDVPHTGATVYQDTVVKIPGAAIATNDANMLSGLLSQGKKITVKLQLSAHILPDVPSANVIGELTGTEKPNEVIVIGGHLDSWDKGRGAHDDGAGVVHCLEAIHLLQELGLHPKRTIRVVLFMNEENGLRGGKDYAAHERKGETHIAALETDAGGFTPRGFGVTTDSARFEHIAKWEYLFEGIDADRIRKGGGGADISELTHKGVPSISLRPDGQKYFDYHHSEHDTLDKVNGRELELGAIAIAILTYVLAEEGI